MSRTRVYSKDTLAIMKRFFLAIETLRECNDLVLYRFCEENGIDYRHFYTQRKDLHKGYFEVGWLLPLIKDYGVSSTWLLTGKGKML